MNMDVFRKNLLNIVIVIVILLIIISVYAFLINQGKSERVYTPDEIMNDSGDFLNKKIIVDGYYYDDNQPQGQGVIVKSIRTEGSTSGPIVLMLPVDHSNINTSGLLLDEIKYRFTGTLVEKESDFGNPIILVAEKIEVV